MKISLYLFFVCFFTSFIYSQTPSFSIKFRLEEIMYHGDECYSKYTISLERCRFYKPEIKYSNDTSKIDWKNLPLELVQKIECNEINNYTNQAYITDYNFRNHDFVFENIFRINIYRDKCGRYDTMFVSFPVKISSFVTLVDFGKLYFYPGNYDLTDNMVYSLNEKKYLEIKPKEDILPK